MLTVDIMTVDILTVAIMMALHPSCSQTYNYS